jgi:K+-transporting ATPase KdpF subunit
LKFSLQYPYKFCHKFVSIKFTIMNATILLMTSQTSNMNQTTGYIVGAVIALLILGYLLYSLIKPEDF